MTISSYPSIYSIGHRAILDIFSTEVLIEEKIDGSQFSFKKISETEYEAKSKGTYLGGDIPNLFKPALETMVQLLPQLKLGWTYRGEAMCRPKHNTLEYQRIPKGGFILFDVDDGLENYLSRAEKEAEAERLGLELVPILHQGSVESFDSIKEFLARDSILGGCKIEGFVVKNYNLFSIDKKVKMGKFVSEAFKEKHRTDWKAGHPGNADIIEQLAKTYCHEGRWNKAIQHLTENGVIKGEPADIGPLMKEICSDIYKEETDAIKTKLFDWAWKKIASGATKGFPQWYKERLAKNSFSPDGITETTEESLAVQSGDVVGGSISSTGE